MIIKKILFILIFFSLTSCGYEPIYSKKNIKDISIKKIELTGDKKVNRNIISLTNLKENDRETGYNLIINSIKKIEIFSKNKEGNASVYRTTIEVNFSLKDEDKIIKNKIFSSSFSYNNMANKFDLSQYQKNIETNLIDQIAEEIRIFLNS